MGKEAGLFGPSGTQTNLVAMLTHCTRGDEYIVGQNAHTFKYEGGGAAVLGGIQPNPLPMGIDGTLQLNDIVAAIKPDDIHFPKTKLVCLENTHAGMPLPNTYPQKMKRLCKKYDLAMHLDGARLFNAAVFGNLQITDLVKDFDSVSFVYLKVWEPQSAPFLLATRSLLKLVVDGEKFSVEGCDRLVSSRRRACTHLRIIFNSLAYDHEKASEVFRALAARFGVNSIRLATNMLHLEINEDLYASLAAHLAKKALKLGDLGGLCTRMSPKLESIRSKG